MKILLCAATGHNPVNILPLESEQISPDLIYVAVTANMCDQGKSLIRELKDAGRKVECLEIENEHSLQSLNRQYENWLFKYQSDIGGLNTKPILISLYDLPDAAKTRAAEYGVHIVAGQSAISSLKQKLMSF